MDETLIKCVAQEIGLPQPRVEEILKTWLLESGRTPQDIGIEELRKILADWVQNLFLQAASGENPFIQLSSPHISQTL